MSYARASAKKLRFIENMILITFPLVLFAGCAGNDVKPWPEQISQTTYFEHEPKVTSMTQQDNKNEANNLAGTDTAPYIPVIDTETSETPTTEMTDDSGDQQNQESMITANNPVTPLPGNNIFYFDTDKYSLLEDQRQELQQHAEYLIANPDARLVINGHADIRGTEDYNHVLSEKRAKTVQDILLSLGASQDQLLVNAFGELQPMHDEDNWQENRRVELDYADPVILSSR